MRIRGAFVSVLSLLFWSCVAPPEPTDTSGQQQVTRLIDQGTAHLRQAELDRAESAFSLALQITPFAPALDGLGCVAFMRGDFPRAERYFIEAYNLDSTYNNPLANLALVYEAQGRYSQARMMYQRAINTEPTSFRARNNLAGLLVDRRAGFDDRAQAKDELLKASELLDHPLIENNLRQVSDHESSVRVSGISR